MFVVLSALMFTCNACTAQEVDRDIASDACTASTKDDMNEYASHGKGHAIEEYVVNADWYKCERNQIKHIIRALINSNDESSRSVFDAGCGSGRWSRFAKQSGAQRVVGVDLSSNYIRVARNMSQSIQYDVHDMNVELPSKYRNKFDIVLNVHLVCHASTIDMLRNFYSNMKDAFIATKTSGKIFTLLENPEMSPLVYTSHIKYGWVKNMDVLDLYSYYQHGAVPDGTEIFLHGAFPHQYKIKTWSWSKDVHESILLALGYTNITWIQFKCDDLVNADTNLHALYPNDTMRDFVMDYYRHPTNIAFTADMNW